MLMKKMITTLKSIDADNNSIEDENENSDEICCKAFLYIM
jgi:hypothetical protein